MNKFNRVVSLGDSFIFGTDLSDAGIADEDFSCLTWPALLSNKLNAAYISYALGGCDNTSIVRRLLYGIMRGLITSKDLICIQWTWTSRNNFLVDDYEDFRASHNPDIGWRTIHPTDNDQMSQAYYKYFQSDLLDKFNSLKEITLAKYILEKYNITYFMTGITSTIIDPTISNSKKLNPIYVDFLINDVKDALRWFDNKGFYQWALDMNFQIGKTGHPLEEAHQAAFEYIIKNYEFT